MREGLQGEGLAGEREGLGEGLQGEGLQECKRVKRDLTGGGNDCRGATGLREGERVNSSNTVPTGAYSPNTWSISSNTV